MDRLAQCFEDHPLHEMVLFSGLGSITPENANEVFLRELTIVRAHLAIQPP
jgi:hypothetical protein